MPLLDLPNEILGSIIDRVDLGDLDHFAESSPLLKSLATHALEVHHERQQEYTHVEVFGCHEHIGPHPLQLVERICANPQVAWYPTSLKVACCGGRGMEHSDEEFAPMMNDEEFGKDFDSEYFNGNYWESDVINVYSVIKLWAEDIRDLVFHSGYFDQEGSECWYNQIRRGNREAVVGLLLTLLPNLETIEFEGYSTGVDLLVKIVQCITGPPRKSSKKTKEGAPVLMKLRELRLCGWGYNEWWDDFGLAGCFARLPSMRRVCAVGVDCRFPRLSSHPWTDIESGSSHIDEIYIEDALINTTPFVDCLRSLKTLRKLHYDWNRGRRPRIRCEDLGLILNAVVEHFQSSLESLCLKGSDCVPLEGGIETSISLDSFKKLTNASFPIQLTSFPKASTPIGDGNSSETSSLPTLSRLVDILPHSMEAVTISGAWGPQTIETLLSGLVPHKAERLPRLSKITFSSFYAHDAPCRTTAKKLQSQCRGLGIELVFADL